MRREFLTNKVMFLIMFFNSAIFLLAVSTYVITTFKALTLMVLYITNVWVALEFGEIKALRSVRPLFDMYRDNLNELSIKYRGVLDGLEKEKSKKERRAGRRRAGR